MNQTLFRLFVSFLAFYLISGCSTPANIKANQDFDFSTINSYALFERDSEFSNWQHLSDFQRNRIELAIENAMDAHQFTYKPVEEADVVVSYFLVGQSRQELNRYNKKVRACLGCTTKELQELNHQIKPSTLIIDILESDRLRSVYRSHVQLKLKIKNDSETNREIITEGVDKLLAGIKVQPQ